MHTDKSRDAILSAPLLLETENLHASCRSRSFTKADTTYQKQMHYMYIGLSAVLCNLIALLNAMILTNSNFNITHTRDYDWNDDLYQLVISILKWIGGNKCMLFKHWGISIFQAIGNQAFHSIFLGEERGEKLECCGT